MNEDMKVFRTAIEHDAERNLRISEVKIAAVAICLSLLVVGSLCLAFYEYVVHEMPNRY